MKLISRLSLIDSDLTSHSAILCVCRYVCACVQVGLVSSEPRKKSRRVSEFWF